MLKIKIAYQFAPFYCKCTQDMTYEKGQYGYDLEWLNSRQTAVEVTGGESRVLVAPGLQGCVLTSTTGGKYGSSIAPVKHDDEFIGGEEHLFIGVLYGVMALHPVINDDKAWSLQEVMPEMVTLYKTQELPNGLGQSLHLAATRRIGIILNDEIDFSLNVQPSAAVKAVAYESLTQLQNKGNRAWTKKNGLVSMCLQSALKVANGAVYLIPVKSGVADFDLGVVPGAKQLGACLVIPTAGEKGVSLGIPAAKATRFLGVYDPENGRLTIQETTMNPYAHNYLSQASGADEPNLLNGDLWTVNVGVKAANGSGNTGSCAWGASSEVLFLRSEESHIHIQRTYHFEGTPTELNPIAQAVLGIDLTSL